MAMIFFCPRVLSRSLVMLAMGSVVLPAQPAGPGGPGGPRGYPEGFRPTHADVAYASASASQTLDLFLPPGDGPFPLLINIHGGAFRFGSKEMLDVPVARAMLDAGIAVATLNYRLSGEAKFPAAVQDVKSAVRFLRAEKARFRLDDTKFVAFGQSAGGNLASLLGTSGDVAAFDLPGDPNAAQSCRVQGVIDWFGPSDFLLMDAHAAEQGCPESSRRHGRADSPEGLYLGAAAADVPDLARLSNPITHITKDDPPFLLQKGENDCVVPVGQSRILFEALRAAGVEAEYDLLKGVGHGDMGSPTPVFLADGNVRRLVDFVQKVTR